MVQLYFLYSQHSGNKTWEDLVNLASNFTDINKPRIRPLIEKTYLGNECAELANQTEIVDNSDELAVDDVDDSSDNNLAVDDSDAAESVLENSHFGTYQFTKQGQYIAVFYDNDYYIGKVISFNNKDEGDVKFLDRCRLRENLFKWPTSDVVDTVSSVFVFDWDFDVRTSNGRMWSLSSDNIFLTVEKKYQLYKEMYC